MNKKRRIGTRLRVVATPSGRVYQEKLWQEAQAAWSTVLDMSDVDGDIAFDFNNTAPTQSQVQALVSAHDPTPTPPPPLPDQSAYDNAIAQLKATFNTARTAAQVNNSIDALTVILRRTILDLRAQSQVASPNKKARRKKK